MRPRAFSVLELIVTIAIVTLMTVAALGLLNETTTQCSRINQRLEQMGAINLCMDRLMDDIIKASENNTSWDVKNGYRQQMKTSHLTIKRMREGDKGGLIWQIDWIAVPNTDNQDLTLYRREKVTGKNDDKNDIFIPLCEHLYSFDLEMIKQKGQNKSNSTPSVIQIDVELFRMPEHDPDYLMSVSQTYCLERFKEKDEPQKKLK